LFFEMPKKLRQGAAFTHILATVAQHEREMISQRTKDALAAAKRRGVRLGNPQLAKAAKHGTAATKAAAKQFGTNVLPVIREIQAGGAGSHTSIAAKLNETKVPTARGGKWAHVQVAAVMARAAASWFSLIYEHERGPVALDVRSLLRRH